VSARYETLHTDIVDRIVAVVAREAYVDTIDPTDRLERGNIYDDPRSTVMRDVMANLVRPNVEYTLAALRALAYSPDGFCLLDGPAQAEVAAHHHSPYDRRESYAEAHDRMRRNLAAGEAVVDLVLDRLALLPVDPRPNR
jgi:hypothetical protein